MQFKEDLINRAYLFAEEKHRGQLYGEQDFIIHPLQVYQIVKLVLPDDIELQCAALLHDCYENTTTTPEEIEKTFTREVAQLISEVTKTSYNTFPKLKSTRGIILKFADRLSNLAHLTDWSEERQAKYLLKSKFWRP